MFEPVIGLEIHLQLKTKTKMFCSCPAHADPSTSSGLSGAAPNTNVCPICLGQPGTLPVPNAEAIRAGIRMGLALGCKVNVSSKFDRKNYFYPDLPKGYQISQYDLPIVSGGMLAVEVIGKGAVRPIARIGITRAHLEEDAAKNLHGEEGKTFVDFNRAGVPLLEMVTEPDFASPLEAKVFLHELRLIARTLGVSDADMEKGQMRCDANISLRKRREDGSVEGLMFNPKTEIKNLNSFRHVERALAFEIDRQTRMWEQDTPPAVSTTRGWNDAKGITEEQRIKESEGDYRFFPEPDIPPLDLTMIAEECARSLPELPAAKRARFVTEYCLKKDDARQLVDDPALAAFAENVFSELHAWLDALPANEGASEELQAQEKSRIGRLVSTWILTKLLGLMSERSIDIRTCKVDAENFAELIVLVATSKLNAARALEVLAIMLESGADPSHVMEDRKLGAMEDTEALADAIDRIMVQHVAEVARYKAGETQLLGFLIGQVVRATEGAADAKTVKNLLSVKLG